MHAPTVTTVNFKKIDSKRKLLGYNISFLAKETSIHSTRLSDLLRGLRQWKVKDLGPVLNVLDIAPENVIESDEVLNHYRQELQSFTDNGGQESHDEAL